MKHSRVLDIVILLFSHSSIQLCKSPLIIWEAQKGSYCNIVITNKKTPNIRHHNKMKRQKLTSFV
jgi:hypothetical protein